MFMGDTCVSVLHVLLFFTVFNSGNQQIDKVLLLAWGDYLW